MSTQENESNINKYSDDAILEQEEKIRQDIAALTPLVGPKLNLQILINEYNNNSNNNNNNYQLLNKEFISFRRIRGDGNCFYRAYITGILEYLSLRYDINRINILITKLIESKEQLILLGYPEITIEDFYDEVIDIFQWIKSDNPDSNSIQERLCDEEISESIIFYIRLLTSLTLQQYNDEYISFLPSDYYTIESFVKAEVEPMRIEADHIQISALQKWFNIHIRVVDFNLYENNIYFGCTSKDDFDGVILLFRPGHYDLLFSKEETTTETSSSSTIQEN